MKGLVTGIELPPRTLRRGRPQIYINAKARRFHARWRELGHVLGELNRETGFTPEMEKAWRGEFWRLGNYFNENRLKLEARQARRRKNPSTLMHAQLLIGLPVAVCGYVSRSERSDPITESSDLVTCELCRSAWVDE